VITLHGGCQCRAHRYTVRLDKPEGYFCHCRMCQQAFGNIFAAFVNVPVDNLDEPGAISPTEHTGIESRVASWHAAGPLPESRIDDNERIRARWQAAYGPEVIPGASPR